MNRMPDTVLTYLSNWAPTGCLIAYWLDKRGDYNVLILTRRGQEYRFEVGAFPKMVGHWGHQLGGGVYSPADLKQQLAYGLWDADAWVLGQVQVLIEHIENGYEIDDILAACEAIYDPEGGFNPDRTPEPIRGPQFSSDGQFCHISTLVEALSATDPVIANEAARKLAAMEITENAGPLFARTALLAYRKRVSR